MTDGEIECGPNAVFTFKREGYGKTDFDLKDTMEALGYGGTWKLFFRTWPSASTSTVGRFRSVCS